MMKMKMKMRVRTRTRHILLLVVVAVVVVLLVLLRSASHRKHGTIVASTPDSWSSSSSTLPAFLAEDSPEGHALCASHGYDVFSAKKKKQRRRKVYDLVMVNSEMDLLEIRLDALHRHVDYFVIVEAGRSFQGGAKPLVVRDNWTRFARFHDKIIYHELVYPGGFRALRTWDNEDLQRDAALEQVLPRLEGAQAPSEGDVLVVADVDEIPRPETLLVLRTCVFPRRLTLSSRFHYYSFRILHAGPEWPHPQATTYEGRRRTIRPTNLRNGDGGLPLLRKSHKAVLANAAWHCSSCFATLEQFLDKMASFSHISMNAHYFRDRDRIVAAVRDARDLWNRSQDRLVRLAANDDVPPLVLRHPDRFAYMLDRDGPSAGFTDYP